MMLLLASRAGCTETPTFCTGRETIRERTDDNCMPGTTCKTGTVTYGEYRLPCI